MEPETGSGVREGGKSQSER